VDVGPAVGPVGDAVEGGADEAVNPRAPDGSRRPPLPRRRGDAISRMAITTPKATMANQECCPLTCTGPHYDGVPGSGHRPSAGR